MTRSSPPQLRGRLHPAAVSRQERSREVRQWVARPPRSARAVEEQRGGMAQDQRGPSQDGLKTDSMGG